MARAPSGRVTAASRAAAPLSGQRPEATIADIGDARVQIEELLSGAPDEAGVSARPTPQSVWQRALPWGVAAAALVVAAVATTRWAPWREPSSSAPLRLSADLGADVSPIGGSLSVSPDGAAVAFVAQQGAARRGRQLYVRRLSQLQPTPLSGTDNAAGPFFSPDSQWIAFFADGKLKKIAATGGAGRHTCAMRRTLAAPPGRRTARLCSCRTRWEA